MQTDVRQLQLNTFVGHIARITSYVIAQQCSVKRQLAFAWCETLEERVRICALWNSWCCDSLQHLLFFSSCFTCPFAYSRRASARNRAIRPVVLGSFFSFLVPSRCVDGGASKHDGWVYVHWVGWWLTLWSSDLWRGSEKRQSRSLTEYSCQILTARREDVHGPLGHPRHPTQIKEPQTPRLGSHVFPGRTHHAEHPRQIRGLRVQRLHAAVDSQVGIIPSSCRLLGSRLPLDM